MIKVWLNRYTLILLASMCCTTLYAHDRSESFSEWTWRGNQLHYTFSVLQREVTRIPGAQQSDVSLAELLAKYLDEQITVTSEGLVCMIENKAVALRAREGFVHIEGSFRCNTMAAPVVTIDTFFDWVPAHAHYAKVRHQEQAQEFLLTRDRRSHKLTSPGMLQSKPLASWQAFYQYLEIGAKHILTGVDHLAFLFGLILLASGFKEMAWLITGFTLGHSVSLALAVLGVAQPNPVMVEALIGFTIALVAIEAGGKRSRQLTHLAPLLPVLCLLILALSWWSNLHWQLMIGLVGAGLFALCYLRLVAEVKAPGVLRLLVTSTFGVIHGFGFAGGLLESDFPAADIAFVLLGFNLGVELGQLVVLAAVIALLLLMRRFTSQHWQQRGSNATVTVLSGLGSFWFISRLLG